MIDGSEKRSGWLNFERQSPHVIERRSNRGDRLIEVKITIIKGQKFTKSQ